MSISRVKSTRINMFKRYIYFSFMLLGIGWVNSNGDTGSHQDPSHVLEIPQFVNLPNAETWSFLPIAGMMCANGSATGIGINLANQSSGKLLIYLEGGGGCWSAATCSDSFHVQNANLNGFDATTLQQVMVTGASQYSPPIPMNYGAHGIWDRTAAENPFSNYNYIYIPYCTADFHAGNLPNSPTDGLSHVGYVNMTKALVYLAGVFSPSSTTEIVIIGGSAGGFGAFWNFPQAQAIFGMIPVTLIAESGPPLPAPYLATSLEESWRVAWGLDETKQAAAPSTHLFPYLQWMAQAYPSNKFAFIEMTGDATVAFFLGVSLFGPNSLSNGLFTMRQRFQKNSHNVNFFLIPSLVHGYIHRDPATWPKPSPPFGDNGLSMSQWMSLAVE